MVTIKSRTGYPKDKKVLAMVEYSVSSLPEEGGILIVGKDGLGREYIPKICFFHRCVHRWRTNKVTFDGKSRVRKPPRARRASMPPVY